MFWYVLLFRTSHFCKGRCWELEQTCRWCCCFCSCLRFHGDHGDHDDNDDHDDDEDHDNDDHHDDGLMLILNFQVSKLGLKPLARIVGYGDAAVEPVDWPVAPALGVQQMLERYFV